MKKIVFIILIICSICLLKQEDTSIGNDAIRLRVIANSNASKDILMKMQVVKKIKEILTPQDSIENTRKNIENNLESIEKNIDELFIENNYNQNYNLLYGYNYFPEKTYNNVKYKEGMYESLVVEIGDSKGDYYWCVLYPALCMSEENNSDVKYKFKIIEIIKSVF